MPALPSASLLNILVNRNATDTATNATISSLQVVCAFPVSGQYGVGIRVLYYVLIAACVFARKAEWLRNACLAAALLFPAVAALHGIVLAAVHVSGVVDMDVYGAFQLCSIGILAGPVTVKLSSTYFNDPGRNTIFVWTVLVLAGLLSLTVEFFRLQTSPCVQDYSGDLNFYNQGQFDYLNTCNFTCSVQQGPFSPMRGGSGNNIYVIIAPDKLTFNTATLLAAACCIPAILSLISMWNKILEINWKTRWGKKDKDKPIDEPLEGTNGATLEKMMGVNKLIRLFLSAVEVPVFGAAVFAILIIGERNFFSDQVHYQTEPIASIGQWAPIVGTGIAALGSLYLLLAADPEPEKEEATEKEEANKNVAEHQCNCSKHEDCRGQYTPRSQPADTPGATDKPRNLSNGGGATSSEIVPTNSRRSDVGNRRKIAMGLAWVGNYLGTASHDRFDYSQFKSGKALDFPEIPGEEQRNRALHQIREQYNQYRQEDAAYARPSRAGSFVGSMTGVEDSSTTPRVASRSPSPIPWSETPRRPHASTLPADRVSFDVPVHKSPSAPSPNSTGGRSLQRRATLEVPSPVYHRSIRNHSSASSTPQGPSSPTIVVSPDPDTFSPADSNPPSPPDHDTSASPTP